jgi:SIR2-like domain
MNTIARIKDVIQDCNLNFLIGSGLSSPYLKTLGNIEILLTQLAEADLENELVILIRASLYKEYFDGVMANNLKVIEAHPESEGVLKNYRIFIDLINSILLRRKSTILSKEANIFTTNIDVFLEKALEDAGVEYNDGFNGRFQPSFSLSNFKKSRSKRSLHYDNVAELPVFNLLKLHGSLAWHLTEQESIGFSVNLDRVRDIQAISFTDGAVLEIASGMQFDDLVTACANRSADESLNSFLEVYDNLLIVNPTKEKFKYTLLNHTYYELLRMFSNELERENTVLFVMGFSFCDEHIRELVLRAANSNPTLAVYVFAYSSHAKAEIEGRLGLDRLVNNNIELVGPIQDENTRDDAFKYELSTINTRIFAPLLEPEDTSGTDQP